MQINSASIDHTNLEIGLHLSETLRYGNQTFYSYDLRFKKPVSNQLSQDILNPPTIHTIEHYLAHYLRYYYSNPSVIVTFFPYGCATGFGCISTLNPNDFKEHFIYTCDELIRSNKPIPFALPERCGNAFMFDRDSALSEIQKFSNTVRKQSIDSVLEIPRLSE